MLMKFLEWYKQYRLDLIAAETKRDNRQFELMAEVVDKQSSFMNKWLESFQITDLPTATVTRDLDQWRAEQDRARGEVDGVDDFTDDFRQTISDSLRERLSPVRAFPNLDELL